MQKIILIIIGIVVNQSAANHNLGQVSAKYEQSTRYEISERKQLESGLDLSHKSYMVQNTNFRTNAIPAP